MGLLASHLDEALLAERAARRAQALAVVDRDLPPLAVGVTRRVVALAGAAGLGLALGPGPEVEHLLGHRPLRHLDQRALVVGHALADAVEADVVGAALQHGVGGVDGVLERARLDGLDQPGDVALDQLVLEGEGGGRDHHAPVVEQRGHQVAQRLAGAGAGLDEQVLASGHRRGDRLGHRHLARPLLAARGRRRRRPAPHARVAGSASGGRPRAPRHPTSGRGQAAYGVHRGLRTALRWSSPRAPASGVVTSPGSTNEDAFFRWSSRPRGTSGRVETPTRTDP